MITQPQLQQILGLVAMLFMSYTYMIVMHEHQQELQMVDVRVDGFVYERIYLPKYYATVNQLKPLVQYNDIEVQLGDWEDYEFHAEIGSGSSGAAYMGVKLSTKQRVVIKTFFDELSVRNIKREIGLLRLVHDHPNIAELLDVIEEPDSGFISIVYPYYENTKTADVFAQLTTRGIKFFLQKILRGLDHAHSRGVIHGDIKPLNIIVNGESQMLKIIDWGLGNFYLPGQEMSFHVGTKSHKSPELLLHYKKYDYQTDMFATGLMFSKMIFRVGPFFGFGVPLSKGSTETDHLNKLARVLGTDAFTRYMRKYNIEPTTTIDHYPAHNLNEYVTEENKQYCSDVALDLLAKMLIVDHSLRITAKDALSHPYFDSVRGML